MNICKRFPKECKCIVCGTNKNGECVMIPRIDKIEGKNAVAEFCHLNCLDVWFYPEQKLIAQKIY